MSADRWLGILLTPPAAAYLVHALSITGPAGAYAAVGPGLFPIVVGAGLVVSAGWIAISRSASSALEPVDWRALVPAAAALLVYILLVEPLGYLTSTTVFVFVEARLLGSRRWIRDLIAAAALALAIDLLFRLLGIRLPPGILG